MKHVAWFLDRIGKDECVVPSPLTDDTYLGEGDEATALVVSSRKPMDAQDNDVAQVVVDGVVRYGRFMDMDAGGGVCVRLFGECCKRGVSNDEVVVLELAE